MPTASTRSSAEEILVRDREFRPHLEALGLTSAEEYQAWCARHGFSQRLDKHWRDRCRERYFAAQQAVEQRLALTRQQERKPRQILDRIFAGELTEQDLVQPKWLLIQRTFSSAADDAVQQAFRELLTCLEPESELLTTQPALRRLSGEWDDSYIGGARGRANRLLERRAPPHGGNTFIEGLLALARHHHLWLHPARSWRPASHSPRRQFSSLATHLLAKYPLPAFLDSAWFRGDSADAARQQGWYVALGRGASPRDLDTPIPLRGQMARHFLKAPRDFLCEEAVRYAQVMGIGGDVRLVHTILGSRLQTCFEHNDFWVTVIHWLVRNPLLDPFQVSPLLDYIHHLRFGPPRDEAAANADATGGDANFKITGRAPEALLRQMRDWHVELRTAVSKPPAVNVNWAPSGIGSFEFTEGTAAAGDLRRWTIVELLSRSDLFEEGKGMRHCVASYAHSCSIGRASIWSLGVEKNGGERKRVLTVEVTNATRTICQARGKANRLPDVPQIALLRRWAAQEALLLAPHVGR